MRSVIFAYSIWEDDQALWNPLQIQTCVHHDHQIKMFITYALTSSLSCLSVIGLLLLTQNVSRHPKSEFDQIPGNNLCYFSTVIQIFKITRTISDNQICTKRLISCWHIVKLQWLAKGRAIYLETYSFASGLDRECITLWWQHVHCCLGFYLFWIFGTKNTCS